MEQGSVPLDQWDAGLGQAEANVEEGGEDGEEEEEEEVPAVPILSLTLENHKVRKKGEEHRCIFGEEKNQC